jgi:hypothetical protein
MSDETLRRRHPRKRISLSMTQPAPSARYLTSRPVSRLVLTARLGGRVGFAALQPPADDNDQRLAAKLGPDGPPERRRLRERGSSPDPLSPPPQAVGHTTERRASAQSQGGGVFLHDGSTPGRLPSDAATRPRRAGARRLALTSNPASDETVRVLSALPGLRLRVRRSGRFGYWLH